ncbi:MAG: hypothetical protein ACJAR6_000507 [Oleispira sp.]|jgi:hypothetical protein
MSWNLSLVYWTLLLMDLAVAVAADIEFSMGDIQFYLKLSGIKYSEGRKVDIVIISPPSMEAIDWADQFRNALVDKIRLPLEGFCNGYWHKIEGMKAIQ